VSKQRFAVSYDIVTDESAAHGDVEERGYVCADAPLSIAVTYFVNTRTVHCDSGDGLQVGDDWLTFHNGMEFFTGAYETRYFHFPATITNASRERIIRLIRNR